MSCKIRSDTFKPELTFYARIRHDPDQRTFCIDIPNGHVFVGEGSEVKVQLDWLDEETVNVAVFTGEDAKTLL